MSWGPVSQIQVLKLGVPDVGLEPFDPHENLQDSSSLLIVGCHAIGKVYGETVPEPLLPASMCFSSCLPEV